MKCTRSRYLHFKESLGNTKEIFYYDAQFLHPPIIPVKVLTSIKSTALSLAWAWSSKVSLTVLWKNYYIACRWWDATRENVPIFLLSQLKKILLGELSNTLKLKEIKEIKIICHFWWKYPNNILKVLHLP